MAHWSPVVPRPPVLEGLAAASEEVETGAGEVEVGTGSSDADEVYGQ